jgi:hypothetical protein
MSLKEANIKTGLESNDRGLSSGEVGSFHDE